MKNSNVNSWWAFIGFLIGVVAGVIGDQPELKLVSVVFRHGDRAPDSNGLEMYPTDPYLNYTFYPMGLGGLTNTGKRREFMLGEVLRQRYGDFLGSIYEPWTLVARSTDYDRTKMSLQLVLAGLYPPVHSQKWNEGLDWQPIPFTFKPSNEDVLLVPEECPKYLEEYERVKNSEEVRAKVAEFDRLMKFASQHSGKNINSTTDLYYLYHTLMAETSMNLSLPKWANEIFPDGKLTEGTNLEYEIISYNDKLKRLNGGMLLRKISEDMMGVQRGTLERGRKMFLYSGHETNVAALQQTLGIYVPHVPEYSSAVIIELHEHEKRYFVKVLWYRGIPSVIVPNKIPGCADLCPLDKFIRLLSSRLPSDEDLDCPKPKTTPPQGVFGNIFDALNKQAS